MSSKNKISSNNYFLILVLFTILGVVISTTALPLRLTFFNYANAHSLPVTENPAPNSIIPKSALPSKLTIDFSERPSPTVSTIQVLNSQNEPVNNGDFKIIGDHDREGMTTLDPKKLTDGVYTVSWQTQSLDDGHIARGSYVFGVGNVGPGAAASIVSGKVSQQHAPQIQAVTSDLDGIIKWPLIVSQAAVMGGIFSHLFLWENFGNKIRIKKGGGGSTARYDNDYDKTSLHWLRRFSVLLVASSIAILVTGSILLILQITELSIHNSIPAYWKVFVSQLSGPSGIAWIMRSLTSLVVIASAVSYYYLIAKRNTQKMAINSNIESRKRSDDRKSERKKIKMYLPLYVALVAGSVSILANSITSHNAGVHFLPSLSIFLDWLHFMAVSIWVGGLFYISSILLCAINSKATTLITTTTNNTTTSTKSTSNSERTRSVVLYYLALLLPRFSLLATISLGVIGVSGIYAAWIQLHSLTALFTSSYGNILIIKLLAALPLVLLGGYHQLRLHRDMALVAGTGRRVRGGEGESGANSSKDGSVGNSVQVSQTLKDKINDEDNNNDSNGSPTNNNTNPVNDNGKLKDIPSKFSKTIKVESLIAIAVLLAASLLTITSPPAMILNMPASGMSTSPSMSGMSGMSGISMQPVKNSTHAVQTKIMNVNTKIEINPFYAGFNTFKTTFTNADGKPNTKVYATELTFTNTAANIGPIVANLHKIRPGVFSITGAYVSQPGEWDIAMAAQRQSDFDLNYEFNAKVTSAPPPTPHAPQSSTQKTTTGANLANNGAANGMQEAPPQFNSFAWLAIVLAGAVVLLSAYYYRRSRKELRKTIEMLEAEQSK